VGDIVIARYQVSSTDPNRAEPASEQIVLVVDHPAGNHNAGDLAFGPDGELYIPLGDGGGGGDTAGNAQNLSRLLGKTLRIHVTGVPTYTIPSGNPYANDNNPNTRAEIWSAGWRNPWRFSFDRETGDLYLGDVGQGAWEEIDFEPANSPGLNYGWNRCEGTYVFPAQNPPQKCSTKPVFDYDRNQGTTVTGGYVYRGVQYPNMIGHYIFADFGSGNFWSMIRDTQGNWAVTDQGSQAANNPSTFGEDAAGELYVADYGSGIIYHLRDTSVVTATPTATTTPTPTATATGTLTPVTPSPTSTLSPTAFPSLTPSGYLPLVHKPE
jgi:glucose/arabinose dehydrogenase